MLKDFAKSIAGNIQQLLDEREGKGPMGQETLRMIVQKALQKCDLVSREEFDAQTAVLQRTRAKLQELEAQVSALQSQLDDKP